MERIKKLRDHSIKTNGATDFQSITSWLSTSQYGSGVWASKGTLASSVTNLARQQVETFSSKKSIHLIPPPPLPAKEVEEDIDTGYAWVVLFCCSIMQCMCLMPMASSGIFYVAFLDDFGRGENTTSWVCSMQPAFTYMLGPLAAIIMDKTNARISTLIGCAGAGIALAIASIANNFEVLFLTYGALSGVFLSNAAIPATTFPAQYFRKYRVLALCLATASSPLTSVFVPPLITMLINKYGWRNANMVQAAMYVQVCVLGMLLKPPRVSNADNHSVTDERDPVSSSYSSDSCTKPELESSLSDKSDQNVHPPGTRTLKEKLRSIMHWRMAVMAMGNFIFGWSSSLYGVLFPDYIRLNGLTSTNASTLLMIYGGIGSASRLCFVVLGQFLNVKSVYAIISGHVILGVGLIGLIFSTDFEHFAIMMTILTIGFGLITAYTSPTIIEMHGDKDIGLVYGIEMFLYGFGATIAPPVAASLNSYEPGFLVGGITCIAGGLIYLLHLLAKPCSRTEIDPIMADL